MNPLELAALLDRCKNPSNEADALALILRVSQLAQVSVTIVKLWAGPFGVSHDGGPHINNCPPISASYFPTLVDACKVYGDATLRQYFERLEREMKAV